MLWGQQGQGALVVIDRLGVGKLRGGQLAGAGEAGNGLGMLAGLFPVIGQQAHQLIGAVGEEPLHGLSHLAVKLAPLFFQQTVIGGLLGQLVFEYIFQFRQARALADHLLLHQSEQTRVQGLLCTGNFGQHAVEERAANDGGQLQHALGFELQAVNARHQHPLQRIGQLNFVHLARSLPQGGAFVVDNCSAVHERANDLFHVKGIAFSILLDLFAQVGRQMFYVQQITDQALTIRGRKRLQPEVGMVCGIALRGKLANMPAAMLKLRAHHGDQQQRRLDHQRHQALPQRQRSGVGPVHVFADDDQRRSASRLPDKCFYSLKSGRFERFAVQAL